MNARVALKNLIARSVRGTIWNAQTSVTALIPSSVRRTLKSIGESVEKQMSELRDRAARPSLYRMSSSERVGMIYASPTDMSIDERLFLYALIRGIRPERVLEIGTRHGGSAAIMACAMEDVGSGKIVCVDPALSIKVNRDLFHGRVHFLEKPSPEAIPEAEAIAGGPFDFALIDGIHVYEQAKKDFEAAMRHMAPRGYLLFHDAFNFGVNEAIKEVLEGDNRLHDCGYLCATPSTTEDFSAYWGLRLVRFDPARVVDPTPALERGYLAAGKPVPKWDAELLNHDVWYCRAIKPCPRCVRLQGDVPAP